MVHWVFYTSDHVTGGLLLPPGTQCITLSIVLLLLYGLGIASIDVFKGCNFCSWQWIDVLHVGVHCLCCDCSSCNRYEAFIVNSKLQPTRCNVSWLIHFWRRSTGFRRFLCPSSGSHNCTNSFRYYQTILLPAATVDGVEWVPSHPR